MSLEFSAQEERELFQRLRAGDNGAGEELIIRLLPVIDKFIGREKPHDLTNRDIKGSLVAVLVDAVYAGKFDPDKGRFFAFIYPYLLNTLARNYYIVDDVNHVGRWGIPDDYLSEVPSPEDAEEAGMFSADGEVNPLNFDPETLDFPLLNSLVDALPEKQRNLVRIHIMESLDVAKTARIMGISRGHAHRLREAALTKIRAQLGSIGYEHTGSRPRNNDRMGVYRRRQRIEWILEASYAKGAKGSKNSTTGQAQ